MLLKRGVLLECSACACPLSCTCHMSAEQHSLMQMPQFTAGGLSRRKAGRTSRRTAAVRPPAKTHKLPSVQLEAATSE